MRKLLKRILMGLCIVPLTMLSLWLFYAASIIIGSYLEGGGSILLIGGILTVIICIIYIIRSKCEES